MQRALARAEFEKARLDMTGRQALVMIRHNFKESGVDKQHKVGVSMGFASVGPHFPCFVAG